MASSESAPCPATTGPATSTQVPHLAQYVVPPEDLTCPEYCFEIEVDFSEKLKDNPRVTHLKEILTALLNSSGGVLQIRSHDGKQPNDDILDKWKRNLEDVLTKFIPRDVFKECVHLGDYTNQLTLYVIKSDKFITMTSGMFVRGLAGTKAVNDIDTICKVISTRTRGPVSHPFVKMKEIKYGKIMSVNEGPNLEYKCWKCSTVDEMKKRLGDDRTSKTLFALPNEKMGGALVIGVEEDAASNSNVIEGQIIEEKEEGELTEFLDQYLKEDGNGNPRVWGDDSRLPELDRDWIIAFLPVVDLPAEIKDERRMLIVISFNHFFGGVCREMPASFHIASAGTVHMYNLTQWRGAVCSYHLYTKSTQQGGKTQTLITPTSFQPLTSTPAQQEPAEEQVSKVSTSVQTETAREQVSKVSTSVQTETARERASMVSTSVQTETARERASMVTTSVQTETAREQVSKVSTSVQTETVRERASMVSTSVQTETAREQVSKVSTSLQTETTQSTSLLSPRNDQEIMGEFPPGKQSKKRSLLKFFSRSQRKRSPAASAASASSSQHRASKHDDTHNANIPGIHTALTTPTDNVLHTEMTVESTDSSVREDPPASTSLSEDNNTNSTMPSSVANVTQPELIVKATDGHAGRDAATPTPLANSDDTQDTNTSSMTSSANSLQSDVTSETTDIIAKEGSAASSPASTHSDTQRMNTTRIASTDYVLRKLDHISWSQHGIQWDRLLSESSLQTYTNIDNLAHTSRLFTMSTPIHWTPARETILDSQKVSSSVIDKALKHIETSVQTQGFGICASEWLKNIKVDEAIQRPQHHLFDVLVADESGSLQLWAIVDKGICSHAEVWVYLFLSGRLIKRASLKDQSKMLSFVNNISIQCRLYQLEVGEVSRHHDDHYLMMSHGSVAEMRVLLAKALLEKSTRIRSILGDDNSILMSAQQMDVIMSMWFNKFNYIEGPPGSGKTLLALHLIQKYENYGYICTSNTFKNFLIHQKLEDDRVFVIASDIELLHYIDKETFMQFDLLIFDDIHNSSFRESIWWMLFESVHKSECTNLVLFGDSRYQNYQENINIPSMHNLLIEFCETRNRHCAPKILTEVHRNTRKVTAFIKANFVGDPEYPDHTTIRCSHTEDGDDVEIRQFPDIWNDSEDNTFVHFVTHLSDPQEVVDNTPKAYEARDVAILVDTSNALCDAQKLRAIFKKKMTVSAGNDIQVHNAGKFPVSGYTIDTLGNFLGMDRRVCILVTSESILQAKSSTGRSINNPRYRAFVASRGISRVVFAVEQPLTTSLTEHFNFGTLQMGVKQLWHLEEGESIFDVSYIDIDGTWAVLYTSPHHSSVKVVSMEGELLPVSVDRLEVRYPDCTASSKDGRRVVLTGYDDRDTGPHRWGLYEVRPGRLRRVAWFDVDALMWSVCWTAGGDVILLLGKEGQPNDVVRVSPTDGRVLWRRNSSVTHLRAGARLAVNPQTDAILVSDGRCVRELDGQGCHHEDISLSSGVVSDALCVDSSSRVMFLSDADADKKSPRWRDIYLRNSGLGQTTKVIQAPGDVFTVLLHEDRYLGVATGNGIVLYDVSALL